MEIKEFLCYALAGAVHLGKYSAFKQIFKQGNKKATAKQVYKAWVAACAALGKTLEPIPADEVL